MISAREDLKLDGEPIIRLESDALRVDVAPGAGGRVVSLVDKASGHEFLWHEFDPRVFPFAWLFASYGGFLGHYTVILEPCTAMPISVNEAALQNQCSVLLPGKILETRVTIRAGQMQP